MVTLWVKTKALMGIDISTRYIKVVELDRAHPAVVLSHYAIADLPIKVLTENDEINDIQTIAATLMQLKRTHKMKTNRVAIGIPGSEVITKTISLPLLPAKELEERINSEARKFFPEFSEDLCLDFYVQPSIPPKEEVDVLLVACRNASVQKRIEMLKSSDLQPEVVDVDYYALERILNYMVSQEEVLNPGHTFALLNFSAQSSVLVVVKNQVLLYAYERAFSSQKLLRDLQHQLKWPELFSSLEADYAKLNDEAAQLVRDTLINHIRHALELFYSSSQYAEINELFIAGDCAIIPHVDELIRDCLGISIRLANPLKNMVLAPGLDSALLQRIAPTLSLSCGLALHEQNT